MTDIRDQHVADIHRLLEESFGRLRPKSPPGGDLNVSLGQLHCLGAIAGLGQPTMSQLADHLRLHPSTVTVLVDGLVAHGLASRKADPRDRRIVRVSETAKGRRNHERHVAEREEQLSRVLAEIDDQELVTLRDGLQILRDAAVRYLSKQEGGPVHN